MSDGKALEVLVVDHVLHDKDVLQLEPGDLLVIKTSVGTDVNHVATQMQKILPKVQVMVCHNDVEFAVVKAPRVEHFIDSLEGIVRGLSQ